MIKLQKMVSSLVMAVMLASGLGTALTVYAQPIDPKPVTADTLGITYPRSTGLSSTDVRVTAANIIRVAMGLLGIIAVIIILIGGFTWMTAGGNDEKIGEARKWIFAGIIGLAIILSAYAITSFVINQLVKATGDTSNTTFE